MTENRLAGIGVNIAYKIHKRLGPGLLESVYEAAFAYELNKLDIPFTRQEGIQVAYEDEILDVGFRADIIICNKLLIEIKSVEQVTKVHHKITMNYMRLKNIKLGLLINFNVELIKEGISRKIIGEIE